MGGHRVITPGERLTLTLRFLATGETFVSLSYQFRISRSAISYIIQHVFKAIYKHMGPIYMQVPSTEEEWLAIASVFETRWQFPNALGAVDDKHIVMRPPADGGPQYYNYKHTHSIILMAIARPDYECIYADIGTNVGVWNKCGISSAIEDKTLVIPSPRTLPVGQTGVPFVFLGNDAFALKSYMMKPYPQPNLTTDKRIYNYRHSRGRRISENLFGILANRWRFYLSTLALPPRSIEILFWHHLYSIISYAKGRQGTYTALQDYWTQKTILGNSSWYMEARYRRGYDTFTRAPYWSQCDKNCENRQGDFQGLLYEREVEWQWENC